MKILVIDDDKSSLIITSRLVEVCGHEPIPLLDSSKALEVIGAEKIQVVISDWEMPAMTGIDLVRALRASTTASPYIYFIILTGTWLGDMNFMSAMDAGADDYMQKPASTELLKVRLRVAQRILKLGTEINTLTRLIPVCSNCRRVRRDDQAYVSLETYISKNSDFRFTHGICPDCMKKLYPEYK